MNFYKHIKINGKTLNKKYNSKNLVYYVSHNQRQLT